MNKRLRTILVYLYFPLLYVVIYLPSVLLGGFPSIVYWILFIALVLIFAYYSARIYIEKTWGKVVLRSFGIAGINILFYYILIINQFPGFRKSLEVEMRLSQIILLYVLTAGIISTLIWYGRILVKIIAKRSHNAAIRNK